MANEYNQGGMNAELLTKLRGRWAQFQIRLQPAQNDDKSQGQTKCFTLGF